MKNKAFTLIELLVVISIVSLLSSVILGSLRSARAKAANTQINQMVVQYVNALELYRENNNGSYPTVSSPRCLGEGHPAGQCGYFNYTIAPATESTIELYGSSSLEDFLNEYLPSYPPASTKRFAIGNSSNEWLGLVYYYNGATKYLLWFLEGTNQTCTRPASAASLTVTTDWDGSDSGTAGDGLATRCLANLQ